MFWKAAHAKYGKLTAHDPDIAKYLRLTGDFQAEGYGGVVGFISDLGHKWVARRTPAGPVLEIGAGTGRHRGFFLGLPADYYMSEYAERFTRSAVWKEFGGGRAILCDARRLPLADRSFAAVISIYNLEHISELQTVLREVSRVLQPRGQFLVALPCEGGLLWNLGREITTRPAFQKKYGINYDKCLAFEHVRDLRGVVGEIRGSGLFSMQKSQLIPFHLPSHHANLIACFVWQKTGQDQA